MIAKNMPYSATLSALTARKGSAFPAMMPQAVPTARPEQLTGSRRRYSMDSECRAGQW